MEEIRRERRDEGFALVGEQNAYQENDLVVREDSLHSSECYRE